MSQPAGTESDALQRQRVALVGRLASMSKRDASQLLRARGAVVVEPEDPTATLVVMGEEGLPPLDAAGWDELLETIRSGSEEGRLEVIQETELWQRLGLVDSGQEIHRLYTPAMLAELLGISVAVIRRWHRRGLIVPAREVRRLPYFDFQEVATARRLAALLAAGLSPDAIERKLEAMSRCLPGVERPLAQLSVIVEGRQILLRQGGGLFEPGGQMRFTFEDLPPTPSAEGPAVLSLADTEATGESPSAEALCRAAGAMEEAGRLEAAADLYRAALAAEGPRAETCFQLAELLYRMGDLGAARERYYMAVELDEDYVEARANLGCLLAEMGRADLALAAFQGALAYHPDYVDAHYHLARMLDQIGQPEDAEAHWKAFLALAPESPWAEQARQRLADDVAS